MLSLLQRLSDAHTSDQYDPVVELQKIQRALGSLSEGEVQVGVAVSAAVPRSYLERSSA